jgi:hypothetical protein
MSHKPLVEDPPVEDDLVPEDDAVIGQAFRRSLWVLLGIGAVVAAVVLLRPKGEQVEVVREKDAGAIADLESDLAVLPEVRFSDVTGDWGLVFVHASGAEGGKYLPGPSSTATPTATRTCSW